MKLMRSLLFVPGHKEGWPEKATASGADGIILDLEDAVPANLKEEARGIVAASIARIAEKHPQIGIYVRINALETGMAGFDLEKIVVPGLSGVLLPKSYGPRDVISCDALLTHFELKNGLASGSLGIITPLETAQAYASCEDILAASPRVETLFAGASPGGDVERSIGYQFTPEGLETLYLRSRAQLAVRASGRQFSLTGVWQDIANLEGARAFAERSRRIGFTGLVLIHPSHVAIANEVFSPSAQEVKFFKGLIEAFEDAEARGVAAVVYEGIHIDYAHVRRARDVIAMYDKLRKQE